MTDIPCSACGSSFSIVDNFASTRDRGKTGMTLGQFELEQRLGAGAFGEVWKASDTRLKRKVAVKIPRKEQINKDEAESFFREARAAAQLSHANIVGIHEVGRENDKIFIVSDFIEGIPLSDALRIRSYTTTEAVKLCREIAGALLHAHELGVVHRDLKPSNIMIDSDGRAHVMDFGLAKREYGELTITTDGQILGTPAYMSPEQAKGASHEADGRSDIYSLGVVLFELLTGEKPFRGNERMLLHQVMYDDPPRPRSLNGNVSIDLETICLKCLEKEPDRRFENAQELIDEFDRFLKGEPLKSRPANWINRMGKWCRRHPGWAATVILSTLLLTSVSVAASVGAIVFRELARKAEVAKEVALDAEKTSATALEETRRRLYAQQFRLANEAWNSGDIPSVIELTNGMIPSSNQLDLRGFEWYLLRSLCAQAPDSIVAHEKEIHSVVFALNDSLLISASADGSIKIWNVDRQTLAATITDHQKPVNDLAVSTDGKEFASAGDDAMVRVWTASSLQPRLKLQHGDPVMRVAFVPGGKWLVTVTMKKYQLGVPPSPGSGMFRIRIWDLENGQPIHSLESTLTISRPEANCLLSISQDGKRIAFATSESGPPVEVWDLESGVSLPPIFINTEITSMAFGGGDGHLLVCRDRDDLGPLPPETWGPPSKSIAGYSEVLALAPNGKQFVVGDDKGQPRGDLGAISVTSTRFFYDGRERNIRPDFSRGLRFWDLEKKQIGFWLDFQGESSIVRSAAWSANGKKVATTGPKGLISIWEVDHSRRQSLFGHSQPVRCVTYARDNSMFASGGNDRRICLWKTGDKKPWKVLELNEVPVQLAIASERGLIVAGTEAGTVVALNIETGKQVWERQSHSLNVQSIFLARDRVISHSSDGAVVVGRLTSGELISAENAPFEDVVSLSLFSNGDRVILSDSNGKVITYDFLKEQITADWNAEIIYGGLQISTDDESVWCASVDGRLQLRKADSGELMEVISDQQKSFQRVWYSPDYASLLTLDKIDQLAFRDPRTGELRMMIPIDRCFAIAPDSSGFLVGGPLGAENALVRYDPSLDTSWKSPRKARKQADVKGEEIIQRYNVFWDRAKKFALRSQWKSTAIQLEKAFELSNHDVEIGYQLVLVLLKLNRNQKYESVCLDLLSRWNSASSSERLTIAWCCVLGESSGKNQQLAELFELEAYTGRQLKFSQVISGSNLLRMGRFNKAIQELTAIPFEKPIGTEKIYSIYRDYMRLIALRKDKQDSLADELLKDIAKARSKTKSNSNWNQSLTLEILSREAESDAR